MYVLIGTGYELNLRNRFPPHPGVKAFIFERYVQFGPIQHNWSGWQKINQTSKGGYRLHVSQYITPTLCVKQTTCDGVLLPRIISGTKHYIFIVVTAKNQILDGDL